MTPSKRVAALLLGLAAGGCGAKASRAAPVPAAIASRPESTPDLPHPPAATSGDDVAVMAIDDAPLAPAAAPLPAARRITTADAVNTPVCLGFLPDLGAAYILTTNNDPGIPEWYLWVQAVGAAGNPELKTMAQVSAPKAAMRQFAPLVKRINAFIRKSKLVACTTTKPGPDQPFEVTVRGIRTTISYRKTSDWEGELVVVPEGKPRVVRSETEVDDLHLVAAYTVPTLPVVVVVLRDTGKRVAMNERIEWIAIDSPAEIAR